MLVVGKFERDDDDDDDDRGKDVPVNIDKINTAPSTVVQKPRQPPQPRGIRRSRICNSWRSEIDIATGRCKRLQVLFPRCDGSCDVDAGTARVGSFVSRLSVSYFPTIVGKSSSGKEKERGGATYMQLSGSLNPKTHVARPCSQFFCTTASALVFQTFVWSDRTECSMGVKSNVVGDEAVDESQL